MKKPAEKSREFLKLIANWQALEDEMIEYAEREKGKTENPFIKTMLDMLRLNAQKYRHVQQMITESVEKEALHLSPEELKTLSGHLTRRLEMEGKRLSLADAAVRKSEVFFTSYLLSYLTEDLKTENALLKRFQDELKSAHISTSVSAKTRFASPEGGRPAAS